MSQSKHRFAWLCVLQSYTVQKCCLVLGETTTSTCTQFLLLPQKFSLKTHLGCIQFLFGGTFCTCVWLGWSGDLVIKWKIDLVFVHSSRKFPNRFRELKRVHLSNSVGTSMVSIGSSVLFAAYRCSICAFIWIETLWLWNERKRDMWHHFPLYWPVHYTHLMVVT